jgi:hypothetical protein
LFVCAFVAFAFFHQGGGWNQNGRFAMVRAIVEEGTPWIDSYLVYAGTEPGPDARLVRVPVRNGEFSIGGRDYAFWWRDAQGRPVPIDDSRAMAQDAGRDATFVEPGEVACTGDVAFHSGHFHPAKAPGGAFVAVPAYFLVHGIGRLAGMAPDAWRTLTLNAWLTTALSVGLLSALGCVLFYRLALSLSGGQALESLLTTIAFAFGTMYLPYGTSLYEHNVIAVALMASFFLLYRVREAAGTSDSTLPDGKANRRLGLAGLCAGYAAITNYIMVIAVLMLFGYLVLAVRRKRGWLWFGSGLLGPFLLICAYNVACFGTPFTTNYSHENPVFKAGGDAFLGLFLTPQWDVLLSVLVSPFRGLFVSAPVLLMGVYGLTVWCRSGKSRPEAYLMISILSFFLLLVMTFNGWHGGWAVGPRYLAPALPFLGLPVVVGFVRFFKTTCALAVLSVTIALLVTAVDPQAPVGNAPFASVDGRPQWMHSPLTDYEWPLFSSGHPWPLLRSQSERALRFYDDAMRKRGVPAPFRSERLGALSSEIDASIRSGDPAPILLARGPNGHTGLAYSELSTLVGPVSVNPTGMYEGWMHRLYPPHSPQAAWNSFNAGEFLFEGSRWSLMPLLVIAGTLTALAVRAAVRPVGGRPVHLRSVEHVRGGRSCNDA